MNALNRVTLEPDLEELAEILEPNPGSDVRYVDTGKTANPLVLIGGVFVAFVAGAGVVLIIGSLMVPAPRPSSNVTLSLASATTKPAVTVLPKQPMVVLAPPPAPAPDAPTLPRKYVSARTGRHATPEAMSRQPAKALAAEQSRPEKEPTQQAEEPTQQAKERTQQAEEKAEAKTKALEWIDPFQQ
jgi:hypothetical protein